MPRELIAPPGGKSGLSALTNPMPGKYEQFDRRRLRTFPLRERNNLVDIEFVLDVGEVAIPFDDPALSAVADAIAAGVMNRSAVVMMMGAHVIKQGLARYVCDMIRRGWVSLVACNGACAIHDFEFARIGATSESVAENIRDGRFGAWAETGELNDIVRRGRDEGLGFGEAVGQFIADSEFPHKDISIFAAAYRASVPVTVHVGIGQDILHQHANCDGSAVGETSYRDFLIFTRELENLEGGVILCYGTAVMGPEVFLKALSMVRNVAGGEGREIRRFTTAVFDLVSLSGDLHTDPPRDTPEYYYRPFKTMLVRTVRDGGRSYYVRGDHRATLPALHKLLSERIKD